MRDDLEAAWRERTRNPKTRGRIALAQKDLDALLNLLASADPMDRISAVVNLGYLAEDRAVAALGRTLQAADEGARAGALRGLARIGNESVRDEVHDLAVNDPSFPIRATAMQTLAALDDPRAASLIAAVLKRRDVRHWRWYRRWAARELVELRAKEAIPALREAKRHVDPITRWRLRQAISALERS